MIGCPRTRAWFFSRVVLVLVLAAAMAAPVSARGQHQGGGDALVGTWHLAALEQPGADGQVHRISCCGLLVFTADGHLSVQVMEPKAEEQAASGPQAYSQGGYEASWGTYSVDPRAHTFMFHVEGALVRALIGKDLPRSYEFFGNELIVRSTRADEHWRVVWKRY